MIFKAYADLRQELKKHHAFGIASADAYGCSDSCRKSCAKCSAYTINMLHSLFIDYGISREREFVFTRNCFNQLPCVSYYDEGKLHNVEVESADWDYAYVVDDKYNKYEVFLSELLPSDLEEIAYNIVNQSNTSL